MKISTTWCGAPFLRMLTSFGEHAENPPPSTGQSPRSVLQRARSRFWVARGEQHAAAWAVPRRPGKVRTHGNRQSNVVGKHSPPIGAEQYMIA